MGSRGNGQFGVYSDSNDVEQCLNSYQDIRLEEVNRSDYYSSFGCFPNNGDDVYISDTLKNKRVQIMHSNSDLCIGFLPSTHAFIYNICMRRGKIYLGNVTASGSTPFDYILIELYAQ